MMILKGKIKNTLLKCYKAFLLLTNQFDLHVKTYMINNCYPIAKFSLEDM